MSSELTAQKLQLWLDDKAEVMYIRRPPETDGSGQEIQLPGCDCSQDGVACQELLWAHGKWLIKMYTWRTVFF